MKRIRGILAPIPTPFDESGELYLKGLKDNLERWAKSKLDGIVVLGSNGEFVMLSREEKLRLLEFVRKNFPTEKLLIAGVGSESFRETLLLARKAYEFGYDAVLVLPPSYYKRAMTEGVLERYYLELAESSPLPLLIYNMPVNTGINLSSDLVVRLSSHPNIVGIKDSSARIVQISEIIAGSSEEFAVFAGSGSFLLPTLVMGGAGGVMAVANVVPDYCAEIFEAYQNRDFKRAKDMQLSLLRLNALVTTIYGVPGLKAALDIIGLYGGPVRSPLLPLGEEQRKEIRQALEELKSGDEKAVAIS